MGCVRDPFSSSFLSETSLTYFSYQETFLLRVLTRKLGLSWSLDTLHPLPFFHLVLSYTFWDWDCPGGETNERKEKKIIGFLSCCFDHSGSFSQFSVFKGFACLWHLSWPVNGPLQGFVWSLHLGLDLGPDWEEKNPHSVLQRPLFLVLSVFVTHSYYVVLRLVFSQSGKQEKSP